MFLQRWVEVRLERLSLVSIRISIAPPAGFAACSQRCRRSTDTSPASDSSIYYCRTAVRFNRIAFRFNLVRSHPHQFPSPPAPALFAGWRISHGQCRNGQRSEEHTSELQSRENLVCRLLL